MDSWNMGGLMRVSEQEAQRMAMLYQSQSFHCLAWFGQLSMNV
jgi:hypothetical protein